MKSKDLVFTRKMHPHYLSFHTIWKTDKLLSAFLTLTQRKFKSTSINKIKAPVKPDPDLRTDNPELSLKEATVVPTEKESS